MNEVFSAKAAEIKAEVQTRLELVNKIIPKLEALARIRQGNNPSLKSLLEERALIDEVVPLLEELERLKMKDIPPHE